MIKIIMKALICDQDLPQVWIYCFWIPSKSKIHQSNVVIHSIHQISLQQLQIRK